MYNSINLNTRCYIAPLVTSAIIGAGASALTSGVNSAMNAKQLAEQRKWQQAENQKDRDFNASEAQKSRDYQTNMYYEDRNWNSVKNQMKQYSDAGLNPSLMMSTGAQSIQGTMPSAPAASSHGSALPTGATNQLTTGLDPLSMSTVQKNIADARNTDEDTRRLEIENYASDLIKYNRVQASNIELRIAAANASMSQTRARQYAEELASINAKNRAEADKNISHGNLMAQEAAKYSEEWQAKQFENFVNYYKLGYRIENADDAINAIAEVCSASFLSQQFISNKEALSRIQKNIAQANDAIKSAKIKDFEIEELQYDHENGVYKARINNSLYQWTIDNNELKVIVDLSETDEFKSNIKETKKSEQEGDRRSAAVQSWARPVSDLLKPAAEAADTYTKIRDAGYSGLDFEDGSSSSNDGTSETIKEREVLNKDGKKVVLTERTRGAKASTSSKRGRRKYRK